VIVGNQRPSRFELSALFIILLLATVLRLAAPTVVEFKRDEANISRLALDFVRGRDIPLLGISSSVGLPNPPVSVYIFAIPYLFTSDPTFATQFVGILNVLAVLLTYLLTRRYYGAGVALLAALLYAVSPWGIIYSRKIWAQDLLPPFVVATLLSGLIGFIEGKRRGQWLCLPLLTVTIQIHYSALVLLLPVAYLIWIGRARWTRAFALSFIPAALILAPFLLGVMQADLPSIDEIQALTSSAAEDEARSIGISWTTLQYAALTIAGTEIHSLAGPAAYQQYLASVPDVYAMFGLLAWGVLFAGIGLLIRTVRIWDSRIAIDRLLLLWLLVPIIVFSITWTTPYPHYLIVMMPAAYILLAVGAGNLWRLTQRNLAFRRLVFALMGILLAGILFFQIVLWLSLVSFLRVNNTPGGFGAPLEYLLPVRSAILAQKPEQVIANLDGQFIGTNDDTTVWSVLLEDVPDVRFVDDVTWVYPLNSAIRLSYCAGNNEQQFYLRTTEEGCYQTGFHNPVETLPFEFQPLTETPSFANGVRVIGYDWVSGDQPCLELVWTISALVEQDYTFSVHFFNDAEQEILNADGLSWRGIYWRPGDTILRRYCLVGDQAGRSEEIAGVNVGMYIYDGINFNNVDILDSAGAPIGQTFAIYFNS
jgi:hypothetical protein